MHLTIPIEMTWQRSIPVDRLQSIVSRTRRLVLVCGLYSLLFARSMRFSLLLVERVCFLQQQRGSRIVRLPCEVSTRSVAQARSLRYLHMSVPVLSQL
jgi:hypothetical protein